MADVLTMWDVQWHLQILYGLGMSGMRKQEIPLYLFSMYLFLCTEIGSNVKNNSAVRIPNIYLDLFILVGADTGIGRIFNIKRIIKRMTESFRCILYDVCIYVYILH